MRFKQTGRVVEQAVFELMIEERDAASVPLEACVNYVVELYNLHVHLMISYSRSLCMNWDF